MRIGADRLKVGIHGEKDIARAGEGRADAFLQRLDAPALPQKTVAAAGAEIGNAQARQFPQPFDLFPHLGLCAGVENIQREITKRAHCAARA